MKVSILGDIIGDVRGDGGLERMGVEGAEAGFLRMLRGGCCVADERCLCGELDKVNTRGECCSIMAAG